MGLIQNIEQIATTELLTVQPTAITLTGVESYMRSNVFVAVVVILVVSVLTLVFFKSGLKRHKFILPIFVLIAGVASGISVYASSSQLETVHYYADVQTSLYDEQGKAIESVTRYWSNQLGDVDVVSSETMVSRTNTQFVDEGEIETAFDSPTTYCVRSNAFYLGCNEDILTADVNARYSLGFVSTLEHIKDVYDSSDSIINIGAGELAFTQDENAEFNARITMQNDAPVIAEQFKALPETFGGIYIKHPEGSEDASLKGRIVLQIVDQHQERGQQLLDEIRSALTSPERIEIEFVEFSHEQLKTKYGQIDQMSDARQILVSLSTNVADNRVSVGLNHDAFTGTPQSRSKSMILESLPEAYQILADPAVELFVKEATTIMQTSVVGGEETLVMNYDNYTFSTCTIGFAIKYQNETSLLTAGHCVTNISGSKETTVKAADGSEIGEIWEFSDGGKRFRGIGVDAAIVKVDSGVDVKPRVLGEYGEVSIWGKLSYFYKGQWLCSTGAETGYSCGSVKCTDAKVPVSYADGKWLRDAVTVNRGTLSEEGDSGGPWFYHEHHGTSAAGIASGIWSDDNCGDDVTVFSKIDRIDDMWDFSVMTE